jgi:hypothetical protein
MINQVGIFYYSNNYYNATFKKIKYEGLLFTFFLIFKYVRLASKTTGTVRKSSVRFY